MKAVKALSNIRKHIALILFIIVYVAIALVTYRDFGLTWDETVNYNRGVLSYQHLFKKTIDNPYQFNKKNGHLDIKDVPNTYSSYKNYLNTKYVRFLDYYSYSGFYPMVLFALNKDKSIERYHLLNILFSLGIFVFLYALLYHYYHDQKIAILGPLFLFLTPRFLGHIPGNPKDIPFAVMYFISCTALYFFASSKKTLTKILVIGLLFGLTQDLRAAAITLYLVLFLFDTYTYYLGKENKPEEAITWGQFFIKELQSMLLIGIVATLFSVLTWPYLGINVIPNAQELLHLRTNFPWQHTVIFQGEELHGTQLPGHYLLTWFAIATPLMILIPALLSPLVIKKWFHNRIFILLLLVLVTNITLYTIIRPLVYDGLRHFLFLVPMISTLGVIAIVEYFKHAQRKFIKSVIAIIILINSAVIARQIVSLHPYQYIFFNSFVGGLQGAYEKYDTEYWGASYNEAINWFKENIATDINELYTIHIWGIKRYKVYQAPNIRNAPPQIAEYIFRFTRRMKEEPRREDIIHIVQRNNTPLVFIMKNSATSAPASAMKWDGDARELFRKILKKTPSLPIGLLVDQAEMFAQEKGYDKVTRKSLDEQREELKTGRDAILRE
jgi:hypothetical protein